MKWSIPAKTFLVGEYAALAGAPAIILTTTPCFEVTLSNDPGMQGIHPESPAGRLWAAFGDKTQGLAWFDPYAGCGGLGASSAQFVGTYAAINNLQTKTFNKDALLNCYFNYGWQGTGLRPSGYDVLAQSMSGCAYINKEFERCQSMSWPFLDIAFLLLHTGKKLATHEHLQAAELPYQIDRLAIIVDDAKKAFELNSSTALVEAVNAYHQQLLKMKLVASHSQDSIEQLESQSDILAIKGCGAMGADVLLLIVPSLRLDMLRKQFSNEGWRILATSDDLSAVQQ